MSNIRHIVFPFDFSEQGRKVAPFVRAHALKLKARVSLLGVIPPPFMPAPPDLPIAPASQPVMIAQLKSLLANALNKELADVDVETVALCGDPSYKIVEYANQQGGMIMMPTHGTGLFRSALIGSVTSKVIHDAHCPVWTAAHSMDLSSKHLPASVLCAVDATREALTVLRWANDYARYLSAPLRVLHIVPPVSDWLGLPSERDLQEELRSHAREKLAGLLGEAGIAAPLTIAVGRVIQVIEEEVRQGCEDLLILGRGASQGDFAHLRSHLYSIVAASPCPTITV